MSRVLATEVKVGDKMWVGREQEIVKITKTDTGLYYFTFEPVTAWGFRPEAKVSLRNR